MQNKQRNLSLTICDYDRLPLCDIYDNTADISGQAVDVYKLTERTGWKEFNFSIPYTAFGEDGEEPNYRLEFLKPDYKIRAIDEEDGEDYYTISQPRIIHDNVSKVINVRAQHVALMLKTKNLDLEFSDELGNNTGTADQLLATILDGSGWEPGEVTPFKEDNEDKIKVRSLVAPSKTGCLGLINKLCDLFDARPIYHGLTQTVDLVPINPFSEDVRPGDIPDEVINGLHSYEIRYSVNSKAIEKGYDTENIVTRLYAYGSAGAAGIEPCTLTYATHNEYILTRSSATSAGSICSFVGDQGYTYYFEVTETVAPNTGLVWSMLDHASRSYVWNPNTGKAYHIVKPAENAVAFTATAEAKRNWFPFLFDFTYYWEAGLLSEAKFQKIAQYQRSMPEYYEQQLTATTEFNELNAELSLLAESGSGFLRLDVSGYDSASDDLKLNIRKTAAYPDGVMYRSDYYNTERKYFSWRVATGLKTNGLAINDIGSLIYIVHPASGNTPASAEIAYIKQIDGNARDYEYGKDIDHPSTVTLWLSKTGITYSANDKFYLFASFGGSGTLHAKLDAAYSTVNELTELQTTLSPHRLYFINTGDTKPAVSNIAGGVGWVYETNPKSMDVGTLYFCYHARSESSWNRAYVQENAPTCVNGAYWYSVKTAQLYRGESGSWVLLDTGSETDTKRLAQSFSVVWEKCRARDQLYKGLYEKYVYTNTSGTMAAGKYAIDNGYDAYWLFSTTAGLAVNKSLVLTTADGHVVLNENVNTLVPYKTYQRSTLVFPAANILTSFANGSIDAASGSDIEYGTCSILGTSVDHRNLFRSGYIKVYENTVYEYKLPKGSYVVYYDQNKRRLGNASLVSISATGLTTGTFETPARCVQVRFVCSVNHTSGCYLRVQNYQNKVYQGNNCYVVLNGVVKQGNNDGIYAGLKRFYDLSDQVYLDKLATVSNCTKQINESNKALVNNLGDLLRDGWEQENNYVGGSWNGSTYTLGDEPKLYDDALTNLKEVAKPEVEYEINFIDLYGINDNMEYAVDSELDAVWEDIMISDAVHLLDEETDTNQWAYVDKIKKCFDQPWKTTVEINTRLSLIGQHSFTDVLSRIAEVAAETKAKQSQYMSAVNGTVYADRLEGKIKAYKTLITGGQSNWYTDPNGNMIFESADGQYAMMLTGRGWLLSNGKDEYGDWNWRTAATGTGIAADEITTGFLSAERIEAYSITVDKLHASVGSELEISSNKALTLFATTDGVRPSGALGSDEAIIQIRAGEKATGTDARIDIMSGGEMNLKAGANMNITGGDVVISAVKNGNENVGGTLTLQSGGNMTIGSDGKLNISSAGEFTVDSPNFKITKDASVEGGYKLIVSGEVNARTGNIAGFTIAGTYDVQTKTWSNQYLHAGTSGNTVSDVSNNPGVYLGPAGLNIGGGKFVVLADGSSTFYTTAESIHLGKTTLSEELATAKSTISGAALDIDAVNGTIDLKAANTITAQTDGSITIQAGKTIKILSGISGTNVGVVQIGSGTKYFTIGSNTKDAYILHGKTGAADWNNAGVYVGTDGIRVGKGKEASTDTKEKHYFRATAEGDVELSGTIHAGDGDIGGWTIGSNFLGSGANRATSSVGMSFRNSTTSYAFWAGGTATPNSTTEISAAVFYVQENGALYASSADIKGTLRADSLYIGGTNIISNNKISLSAVSGSDDLVTDSELNTTLEDYASLEVLPGEISAGVWDELKNNGSGIKIEKTKITISSGGSLDLSTAGALTISTAGGLQINKGNFQLDASGNATMTGGSITIKDGNTENFKVTNKGVLTAVSGTIGGWSFGSSHIGNNSDRDYVKDKTNGSTVGLSTTGSYAFWAGGAPNNNPKFGVTSGGHVDASDITISGGSITIKNGSTTYFSASSSGATINGTLTAGSGSKIGSFNISTAIYSGDKTGPAVNKEGVYVGTDAIALGAVANSTSVFQVTNKGVLTAKSGTIGSFTINSALYTNGKQALNWFASGNNAYYNPNGVYVGSDGISCGGAVNASQSNYSSKFSVTSSGKLYAQDVDINGKITANNQSTIAGWSLANNWLWSGSDQGCVCLSPGTTSTRATGTSSAYPYVFWAGANWPDYPGDTSNIHDGWAPVKITKNGTVACRYLAYLEARYKYTDTSGTDHWSYDSCPSGYKFDHYYAHYIDLKSLLGSYEIASSSLPATK